jgi:short-subunit dehydrogenase
MFMNKVVAITGAGSGIGQAMAVTMAAKGARLALSDVNAEGLERTRSMLPAGAEARLYKVDVGSRNAVSGWADDVVRDFATVHVIVNNAGTSVIASIEHVTVEEMERVLQINLWGVIYGTKAFLPKLLAQREGCIVNISSVFGLVATPCSVAYTISKFGVRGLTETLWQELEGTGVRAVLVHPGGTNTNITNAPKAQFEGEFERAMKVANMRMMISTSAEVAEQIVDGLERGDPRLLVGNGAADLFSIALAHPDDYGSILREQAVVTGATANAG